MAVLINIALAVRIKTMELIRDVFAHVLHRRLGTPLGPGWTPTNHWGSCGQSCPCCRAGEGEGFGSCDACESTDVALQVACKIAAFIFAKQCKQDVVFYLVGKWRPCAQQLPLTAIKLIHRVLPEIHGIVEPAGVGGVAL